MEENMTHGLREERIRRRRVKRLRNSIISGVAIWILLSAVLIVTLLVKVVRLENKLGRLETKLASVEQLAQENSQNILEGMNSGSEEAQEDGEAGDASEHTEDNQKMEGQVQKVYLTFDDGPSDNTSRILDILKEKNVKATFFVIGKEDEESQALYQRIVAEGHTLGMHSFTHKYNIIYDSLDSFAEDVNHLQSYLAEVTGVEPEIMRFPGGSSNKVSNTDMKEFIRYLNEKNIRYYDWNIASGDATSQSYTAEQLVDNVITDVGRFDTSIVLMHDASNKDATVEALEPMIDQLQAMGVEILPIDENTKLIQHISADSVE